MAFKPLIVASGFKFLHQRSTLGPLHWEHAVLVTGQQGSPHTLVLTWKHRGQDDSQRLARLPHATPDAYFSLSLNRTSWILGSPPLLGPSWKIFLSARSVSSHQLQFSCFSCQLLPFISISDFPVLSLPLSLCPALIS